MADLQQEIANRKAAYWQAKENRGKMRREERVLKRMNIVICPDCWEHKETRKIANRGPFEHINGKLVHRGCPHGRLE